MKDRLKAFFKKKTVLIALGSALLGLPAVAQHIDPATKQIILQFIGLAADAAQEETLH